MSIEILKDRINIGNLELVANASFDGFTTSNATFTAPEYISGLTPSNRNGTSAGYSRERNFTPGLGNQNANYITKRYFSSETEQLVSYGEKGTTQPEQSNDGGNGFNSPTTGYFIGGIQPQLPNSSAVTFGGRFPFSSELVTGYGITSHRVTGAGQFSGPTNGYSVGGDDESPIFSQGIDDIKRYPFALLDAGSPSVVVDVGNLTSISDDCSGFASENTGYKFGGHVDQPPLPFEAQHVEKFPFASDVNSTDTGIDHDTKNQLTASDDNYGYAFGGNPQPSGTDTPATNTRTTLDVYPFASDIGFTNIPYSGARRKGSSYASVTDAYAVGGAQPPPGPPVPSASVIFAHRFSFNSLTALQLTHDLKNQQGEAFRSGGWQV